jgi:ABC-2 type transport system ATP-binding protein
MLSGLILPTSGDITIEGLDMKKDTLKIKEFLNVSPQETAIAPNLTVKENLEFMAGVYQIKNKEEKIAELVKQFKLDEVLKKKAKALSGGWQRKVSIAISLINDPKILFLDEPTLGLDVIARKELWKVIEGLKGKKTIILTTHYMEEAESLSDRIGIMAHGELVDVGTAEELVKKTNSKNFEDAFVSIATGGEE